MRLSSFVLLQKRVALSDRLGKEPDQHSSAMSLRIAYYRPSSVNEALFL